MNRGIVFDKKRCIGCYSCVVACKQEQNLPPFPKQPPESGPEGPESLCIIENGPKVVMDKIEYFFEAEVCMHCEDALCIDSCEEEAIYRDEVSGAVLVDQKRCNGCAICLAACPYDIPQFYNNKMVKCDLCIHRLRQGKKAACEQACPARAIKTELPSRN
ncbi:MAG: 4Fe-4S binding protein [Deltaproteobacteria bacterium]|nr:4Fe-4S binding protein [Deltaproteobacteria bacterium]